jgi:hypothetical protein
MGTVQERVHGKPTVPAMDYESTKISTLGNTIVGDATPTTLHVITFNKAGTSWVIDVWRKDTGGTSAGAAFIDPATQGTFGYNIFGLNGFIINSKSGTPGDMTVVFRTSE